MYSEIQAGIKTKDEGRRIKDEKRKTKDERYMRKIVIILLLLACLPLFVGVKHFKGRKVVADYNVT